MSPNQSSDIYGQDLAAIYHEHWEEFALELWPRALGLVRKHAPGAATWLDLCCGTGATLREARKEGFLVAGVDLSPHQIKQARQNVPDAELTAADIRKLALGRHFDVVSCFYDSLNYLLRKSDLQAAFRRARRHLEAGGVFVFDINTLEGMRQNWNQTLCLRGKDYTAVWEFTYDEDENLGQGRFEGFVRDKGKDGSLYRHYDEMHYERGYEADEVEEMLAAAGFRMLDKLDAYTGTRVNRATEKLLYACGGQP